MSEIKKVLIFVFFILIVFKFPAFANSSKVIEIYLDGQKIENSLTPVIINKRVLLPLRTTSDLFNVPLMWDSKSKSVKAVVGDQMIFIKVNEEKVRLIHNGSEYEIELDQSPQIIKGRVYVPLRFVAEMVGAEVKWERPTNRVAIWSPVILKGEKWYVQDIGNNALIPVEEHSKCVKVEDITYFVLKKGDSTVGENIMYALYPNGKFKKVFRESIIRDFQIEGDECYYINDQKGYFNLGTLRKVNLKNAFVKIDLGIEGYAYDSSIALRKLENIYYYSLRESRDWQVRHDGIYIKAYDSRMALDDRVKDMDLLRSTYGYYLVDKNERNQKMIRGVKDEPLNLNISCFILQQKGI